MKKIIAWMGVIALLFSSFAMVEAETITELAQQAGYEVSEDIAPAASILVDVDTGQILWADNATELRDPASTTKMMVVYLTMEAVKSGAISLDTEVIATETDQAIASIYALSNNKIQAGVSYTIEELLMMTLVPSSNVSTLMLAHAIHDGDDASFLQLMNQTARELGMTDSTFVNATGAVVAAFEGYYAPEGYDHNQPNMVTVKDFAILASTIIRKHPEVLNYTRDRQVTVKAGTPYEETFDSYNHSLPGDSVGFEGTDGLKTGSSPSAGYNGVITAQRGDTRLLAVVMGTSAWGDPQGEYVRHYFVNGLFELGFGQYQKVEVLSAGQQTIDGVEYQVEAPLTALVREGDEIPQVVVENDRAYLVYAQGTAGETQSVVVTPVHVTPELQNTENPVTRANSTNLLLLGVLLIVLVLGIFIVLYRLKKSKDNHLESSEDQELPRSRSRRARGRRRR